SPRSSRVGRPSGFRPAPRRWWGVAGAAWRRLFAQVPAQPRLRQASPPAIVFGFASWVTLLRGNAHCWSRKPGPVFRPHVYILAFPITGAIEISYADRAHPDLSAFRHDPPQRGPEPVACAGGTTLRPRR